MLEKCGTCGSSVMFTGDYCPSCRVSKIDGTTQPGFRPRGPAGTEPSRPNHKPETTSSRHLSNSPAVVAENTVYPLRLSVGRAVWGVAIAAFLIALNTFMALINRNNGDAGKFVVGAVFFVFILVAMLAVGWKGLMVRQRMEFVEGGVMLPRSFWSTQHDFISFFDIFGVRVVGYHPSKERGLEVQLRHRLFIIIESLLPSPADLDEIFARLEAGLAAAKARRAEAYLQADLAATEATRAVPLLNLSACAPEAFLPATIPEPDAPLSQQVRQLMDKKCWADAMPLAVDELQDCIERHGPWSVEAAASHLRLAVVYEALGDYAISKLHYKLWLEIREAATAEDDPSVVSVLTNLASMLKEYGSNERLLEAEGLLKRASGILLASPEPDPVQRAEIANSMNEIMFLRGEYALAEPLAFVALKTAGQVLGQEHLTTAIYLHNVAECWRMLRYPIDVEPLFKRALSIKERESGTASKTTYVTVNSLAHVMTTQGRFAEAEPLWRRSVDLCGKLRGLDNYWYLEASNNLGFVLQKQGKLAEAEDILGAALARCDQVLGKCPLRHSIGINLVSCRPLK